MNEEDRIALECAKKVLIAKDFSRKGNGAWEGKLDIGLGKPIRIQVKFKEKFPYELPELYIDCNKLPRLVPHVDRKGKICIADEGILIDSERPGQIVMDVLGKAESLLRDGLEGKLDADIGDEFLSYLDFDFHLYSVCSTRLACSKEISLLEFKGFNPSSNVCLFADDLESGKKWLNKMDFKFLNESKAWFYILSRPIIPPDYKSKYRNKHFFRDIQNNSSPEEYNRFKDWLKTIGLPAFVLVSIPVSETSGKALYAVFLNTPPEKEAKKGGFREKPPFERDLNLIQIMPIEQSKIVRLDREYLVNRGGALSELSNFCVAIVGCGAVGSHLAEQIAAIGVGNIKLIDKDLLSNDNVHRHFLGVECLRMEKASAMKLFLERRFPHLNIEYMCDDIIDILEDKREFITEANLLCIAIGQETLELNINRILKQEMPRLHAWVEPLGIGGHVFATGLSKSGGCFRCLFERDENLGLKNMSSFSAAGQIFQKTYAGCSGFFTPYSVLHAERTAIEAAGIAVDILTGLQKTNCLLSWYGDPSAFLEAKFRQSERIRLFKPGQVLKCHIPQRQDCICKKWQCS